MAGFSQPTRRRRQVVMVGAVSLCVVFCHGKAAPARKWSDVTGQFSVEAELVNCENGVVQLRMEDGRNIPIPLTRLSEADQGFVQRHLATNKPSKNTLAGGAKSKTHGTSSGEQKVIARGVGDTVDSALKNALRSAVEQVVGTVIDAETIIRNDDIVSETILSYSDGYVNKYSHVKDPVKKDGLIHMRIVATVARSKLVRKLEEVGIVSRKIDGTALFARAVTELKREEDSALMVRRIFQGFPGNVTRVELVGEPRVIDKNEDNAQIGITARFSVDETKYRAWLEAFKPVLSKIATEEHHHPWNSQQFEESFRPVSLAVAQGAWKVDQLDIPWNERRDKIGKDHWGRISISDSDLAKSYTAGRHHGAPGMLGNYFPNYIAKNALLIIETNGGRIGHGTVTAYELNRRAYAEAINASFAFPIVNVRLTDKEGRHIDEFEKVAFFRGGYDYSSFRVSVFWEVFFHRSSNAQQVFMAPNDQNVGSGFWNTVKPHDLPPEKAVDAASKPENAVLISPTLSCKNARHDLAWLSGFQYEFVFDLDLSAVQQISNVELTISSRNNLLDQPPSGL